ncbi:DUF2182 domain-containing protein [Seohaeicola saemankumensis]|nr:DUF2182 domain-containing protein [Seohaeicola saemankumensis]MCA0873917.1 DUF2182 domain-containing protein [Seohaeicola saemankumensis]
MPDHSGNRMRPAGTHGHQTPGAVERLAARDVWIVAGATSFIVIVAGLYTVLGVGMNMSALQMTAMARDIGRPMSMGMGPQWSAGYAVLIFLMWWVMMIAMMTPSVAPMLLLFAAIKKTGPDRARAHLLTWVFLFGYLSVWAGFSAVATGLQWGLQSLGLVDGAMMTIQSRGFAGLVLLLAGLFQFSTLKTKCLEHCRSPAHFLAAHRRPGASGALFMGMRHGTFCLGCCWALMALLFVGGIMNLYWIVGLALYVLAEKLAPRPDIFNKLVGVALIAVGLWVTTTGFSSAT